MLIFMIHTSFAFGRASGLGLWILFLGPGCLLTLSLALFRNLSCLCISFQLPKIRKELAKLQELWKHLQVTLCTRLVHPTDVQGMN